MIGQYFYNNSTRNVVVAFGTIFNTIQLHKKDGSGNIVQSMKVPLAYGPKQKWLSRLTEDPNLNKKVAVTLPRIGFEISGIAYDPARKLQKTVKVKKVADGTDTNQVKSGFMPVPYNINFELYVLSKNSDDALQIVEQILPFFQPDYTVTMKEVPELDIIRDVPIILNSVGYEDDYEGTFTSRRSIIYTLSFTAKYYMYGPVTASNIIRKVQVDQYADLPVNSPKREQRYSVTPNPSNVAPTSFDPSDEDNFGFNEVTSFFQDAKNYDEKTGTDTDDA
tara:strand:+ start:477 stop:1310 length:834 start_codon:yes stop_codon:yes gene_type:complete